MATQSGSTNVVGGGQGAVRPADLAPGVLKPLKGLRRCHLVDKMPVCQGERQNLLRLFSCVIDGNQPM